MSRFVFTEEIMIIVSMAKKGISQLTDQQLFIFFLIFKWIKGILWKSVIIFEQPATLATVAEQRRALRRGTRERAWSHIHSPAASNNLNKSSTDLCRQPGEAGKVSFLSSHYSLLKYGQ